MAIQLRDRADAVFIKNVCPSAIRSPDLDSPDAIHAVKIGLNKTPEDTKLQIEVPVRIILHRGFGGLAAETHIVRFNASEWNEISKVAVDGTIVTLKNAIVVYDDSKPKTIVDTTCHVDFGDGYGYEDGIRKEYVQGWIRDISSVEVTKDVFSTDESLALSGSFMSAEELEYCQYATCTLDEEYLGDDFLDDYEPRLSDYYDDMEELELNTRGDGYD